MDQELLVGMSDGELDALAEGILALPVQTRLDELLDRNNDGQLNESELVELDCLLRRVDQLTILKTRARYTLGQRTGASKA